jgi:hypothetical protein
MSSRREPPSSVTLFPRPAKSVSKRTAAAVPAVLAPGADLSHIHEQVSQISEGLTESLALLQAIDLGELLSAAPPGSADRRRHETAVGLLSIQDRLLQELLARCHRLQALE